MGKIVGTLSPIFIGAVYWKVISK